MEKVELLRNIFPIVLLLFHLIIFIFEFLFRCETNKMRNFLSSFHKLHYACSITFQIKCIELMEKWEQQYNLRDTRKVQQPFLTKFFLFLIWFPEHTKDTKNKKIFHLILLDTQYLDSFMVQNSFYHFSSKRFNVIWSHLNFHWLFIFCYYCNRLSGWNFL